MCELFGLTCNKPVTIGFTWRGFIAGGVVHRDGWGVAFYPDGMSACIIKEPRPSVRSPMACFLKSANIVRSKIVISHVRMRSVGEVAYHNTHPFVRELLGREWIFAHNGTVIRREMPAPRFYEPVGETDSERAFCLILDGLREIGRATSLRERVSFIEGIAGRLSNLSNRFNFLMSDGEYLYAFKSGIGSLYYTVRVPPHTRIIKLVDEDFEVDLSDLKGEDEVATIIATRKLTVGEDWIGFPEGKLMVFKDGLLHLSAEQWGILRYVRKSPHRVSVMDISVGLGMDVDEVAREVAYLREIGMLRQDSRNRVPPTSPDATFYTNPDVRRTISSILNYLSL
jgi:glutamine amidotransferase